MKKIKVRDEEIIERWLGLYSEAQGRGEEVLQNMIENLKAEEVPNIEADRALVISRTKTWVVRRKRKREFLTVAHKYLKGYIAYISARDYGRQLAVSWYLTVQPTGFLKRILDKVPDIPVLQMVVEISLFPYLMLARLFDFVMKGKRTVLPAELGLFDTEELSAFATTVHHALLGAVEELLKSLNQDTSKIDRRTNGFLKIA